jgi:hypothetical protein
MRLLARFVLLLGSAAMLQPLPVWAWGHVKDGIAAASVLIEDSGDVVSAGVQLNDTEVVVVKHSGANGLQRWRYVLNSVGPTYRSTASLARDAAGAIFVASFQGERYGNHLGFVAKIDPQNGQEIWRVAEIGAGFYGIAVDSAGDVVVAGRTSGPEATDQDLIAIKLSGETGTELWRVIFNGETDDADGARAVIVDASNNVFVGGRFVDNPVLGYPDFVVLKLSGLDGSLLWRSAVPSISGHGGEVLSLALDRDGDVVAAGYAVLVGWCDFVVAKFAGLDGRELWRAVADDGGGCDRANAVAIDALGDVLSAGSMGPTLFSVMKFAGSSGGLLWRHDVPNVQPCTGGDCAGANALASDSAGNVLATGRLAGNSDVTVVKLAAQTGGEMWHREIDIDGCGDGGHVVSIDLNDDVVIGATGFARVGGECAWPEGSQYVVLKLTGPSGKDYWAGCHDDRDNDGDGLVDYPVDPQCTSPGDATERQRRACGLGFELVALIGALRWLPRRRQHYRQGRCTSLRKDRL